MKTASSRVCTLPIFNREGIVLFHDWGRRPVSKLPALGLYEYNVAQLHPTFRVRVSFTPHTSRLCKNDKVRSLTLTLDRQALCHSIYWIG